MVVKRLKASTIAEVVIALTIIAICFAVASQVFVQSSRSTIQFQEVKEQTAFQSMMFDVLISDTLPDDRGWKADLSSIEDEVTVMDSCKQHQYILTTGDRKLWEQEVFYEK